MTSFTPVSLRRFQFTVAMAGVGTTLAGCTSSQHRLVAHPLPPAPINVTAMQPPVEAKLYTVIAYDGPGAWKRRAYWDEYVVTLANRGNAPVTIESAALVDSRGGVMVPGDDPWSLEEASRTWWRSEGVRVTGAVLGVGAGSAAYIGSLFASAMGAFGGAGSGAAGIAVLPFAAPAIIAASVAIDEDRKDRIQAEFARRRLVLPRQIGVGEHTEGSLFFRLTPGPRQLVLRCSVEGHLQVVTMDLSPLAGLHLAPRRADTQNVAKGQGAK
jgi:hypothetical protein